MQNNSKNNQISSDSKESSSNAEEFFVEQVNLEQFNNFIEQLDQGLINSEQIDNMLQKLNNNQIKAFFTQLTDDKFIEKLNEEQFDKFIEKLNKEQLNEFIEKLNEEQLNQLLIENTNRLKSLLQFNVVNNEEEFQLVNQEYDPNNTHLNLNNLIPNKDLIITNNPNEYPNNYTIGNGNLINKIDIPDYVEFIIRGTGKDSTIYSKDKKFSVTLTVDRIVDTINFNGILDNIITNEIDTIKDKKIYNQQLQALNNKLALVKEALIQEEVIQQGIASQIQKHNNSQPVNEYEDENNALIQEILQKNVKELDPNHDFQDEINEDEDEIEMENQRLLIQNSPEYELKFEGFKQQCLARPSINQLRYLKDFKDFTTKEDIQYLFKIPEEVIDAMQNNAIQNGEAIPGSFMHFWKTINPNILENGNFVFGYSNNDRFSFNLGIHQNDYIYRNGFYTADLIYLLYKEVEKYLETTLEIDLSDLDYNRNISEQCIEKVMNNHFPKTTNFKQILQSTIKALETINPNIKNNNDIGNTIVQKIFDSIDFTQNFSEALKLLTETIETIVPEYNLNNAAVEIFINKFYNEPEKLKLFFENKFFTNSLYNFNSDKIKNFVMNKILYNNEEGFKDDEKFKQIIELPFVQQNFGYNKNNSLRSYFINLHYSAEKANISDEKLAKLLTLASKNFNFFNNLNGQCYDNTILDTRSAIKYISKTGLYQCLLNNICKGTNGEYLEVLFPQNNDFGKIVSEQINTQQLFLAIKEKGAIKNFIKILNESSILSFYNSKYDNGKNELKELLKAEIELDNTLLKEALKYPKFFNECELINTNIFNEYINELHETGKLNDFLNDIINADKSYLLPVFELSNPHIINYKLKNINEKIMPEFYKKNDNDIYNYYNEFDNIENCIENCNAEKLLLLFKDFANTEIYDFTPLRNYNGDSSSLSSKLEELANRVEDSFNKIEHIINNSQNSIITLLENLNFENVEPKLLFCIINNLYFLDNNNKELITDALKKNQSMNNLSSDYCNELCKLNNSSNRGDKKNMNPIFTNIYRNNLNLQRELKNNITVTINDYSIQQEEQASRRRRGSALRIEPASRIGQNKKTIEKEIIDKMILNREENFDTIFEAVTSYIPEKKDLIHLICNFNDPKNLVKTMEIFPNLKNDKMFIAEYIKEILENKLLGQTIFDKIKTDDLIKNYIDNIHKNDFSVEVFNKSINDYVNQNVKVVDLGAGTSDVNIKQEINTSKKQYKNSKMISDNFELNKINTANEDFDRVDLYNNTTKTLEDLKK